jgi:hypothetical protein
MKKGNVITAIIVVGVVIILLLSHRTHESFGTSPGTMVQLQTSHVPTEEDAHFYTNVYPKIVRKEITDLTAEDPGPLRPWIFPWYGRGVSFYN